MMKNTTFLLLALFSLQLMPHLVRAAGKSTSYYLDADKGNDTYDGKSSRKPWKSLSKVKLLTLKPGDSILLRRGTTFHGILEISGQGKSNARIIVDAYGSGRKPCITAPDSSLYAVLVNNADYLTVQNLEITNKGTTRMPYRTGIKVQCRDYGISKNITLNALDIRDVNGSLIKKAGGGSGILIENRGRRTVSVFDSLLIENCTVRRCERNAIIWSAPWDRKQWHPNTNVVVRKNLIEEVPGDGIVPIGCDGAIVEYNLMRNCTDLLDIKEAAAGIWPWSCDNTLIQFNEVSDHKAPWDGQGFDSDFNCTNTVIKYNYSHDNDGGFILICNAGKVDTTSSIGNIGTQVQYNISVNDAIRNRKTHAGTYFSPTIHIGGPVKDTKISYNILHSNADPKGNPERGIIASLDWDGYAANTDFYSNVFYAAHPSFINLSKSTGNKFLGNYYLGNFQDRPNDAGGKNSSALYSRMLKKDPTGFKALAPLMQTVSVGDGAAVLHTVNKEAIEDFFSKMQD